MAAGGARPVEVFSDLVEGLEATLRGSFARPTIRRRGRFFQLISRSDGRRAPMWVKEGLS